MNRGERRRQERLNIGGNILYHSGGISQEAVHKHHSAGWPEPEPGKHLWTVTGVWRIADPSVARYNLDIENLVTIEGPGCLWCEEPWTAEGAAALCPGDASRK